ncbi:ras-domain-containing protein [Nemania sp. NC0429]|nr:ras-domain-containing protein [Nemania sp. NC0429]
MRDLYMKTGQGFLLVFSITSPSSLEEIAGLRDEIIRIKDDVNVPMVICGNKADLEDQRAVPRARGFEVSQRWGAPYYETSARNKTNVDEVFTDLCRQILRMEDIAGDAGGARNAEYEPYPLQRRRRRRHNRPKCVIL